MIYAIGLKICWYTNSIDRSLVNYEVVTMKADFITAVKLNEKKDFVTYLFDVNVQWEDLDNEQSGIVEIDRNVFEMLEQNVEPDPNFIMKQMYDRHIRIMQHASEMDIDRCCINRVPYYIIGQILGEYSISHQLSETPIFIYPDLLKLVLADDQVRDIFMKHKVMSDEEIQKLCDEAESLMNLKDVLKNTLN